MLLCSFPHGNHSPGAAFFFCLLCHIGICHIAVHAAAQLLQPQLADPGLCHIRIADDHTAFCQGLPSFFTGTLCKKEIFRIIKICCCMDHPLYQRQIFFFYLQTKPLQLLSDDLHACPFNITGSDMLCHAFSFLPLSLLQRPSSLHRSSPYPDSPEVLLPEDPAAAPEIPYG